jgi:signal transduction histidine kinase
VRRLRHLLPIAFPGLLLALAYGSIVLTRNNGPVAAMWPVNAAILAFLVRWARDRRERRFSLAMSFLVVVTANLIGGSTAPAAIGMAALNITEVAVVARLLRRDSNPVANLKGFAAFLLGPVLLAPMVSGAMAALMLAVLDPAVEVQKVFLRWTFAEALGMAIVGSFLLTVGRPFKRPPSRRELAIFGFAQLMMGAAAGFIFFVAPTPPLFMIFPFLAAAAISQPQIGGVTAVFITSVMAVGSSLMGHGTAAVAGLAGVDQLLILQVFLAGMAFAVLPVAAILQRLEMKAAELEAARRKAEALSGIKTRLLAHVSHEIRSPLAGVTTLAELLRDGALGELTPPQRETLDQIAASGAQVTDLARDLTDAAAIQTGKARVQVAEVGVADAIASAVKTAGFRAAQYGAVIEVAEGGAHALTVAADPLRLRQILVNLLLNGAKYGGRPPHVRIEAKLVGGYARFEISDNGAGVSEARRTHLFRDFERLGAERTDLEGAGLGLAVSKQIAELQNGGLGVEDGDLGGACFWLQLPLWRRTAHAA